MTTFNPTQKWAVWHVKWDMRALAVNQEIRVAPFPFRLPTNAIVWPLNGEGWYWSPEVIEALQDYSGAITVLEGYGFQPSNPTIRPFAYMRDLYEQRQRFKAERNDAEKVIKLGLNATYGKLAQGYGYDGALPRQHSIVWAGLITSMTRAELYRNARQNPQAIIAFATDALWSEQPLNVKLSQDLGAWEAQSGSDFLILQPGVYHLACPDEGEAVVKTRGYDRNEMSDEWWKTVRDSWKRDRLKMKLSLTIKRFIGLGYCVGHGDWQHWCMWMVKSVQPDITPKRGNSLPESKGSTKALSYKVLPPALEDWQALTTEQYVSQPYRPKRMSKSLDPIEQTLAWLRDQPDYETEIANGTE